jgi:enoyl-CoA hydratase
MSDTDLTRSRQGPVLVARLNRPAKANSINQALVAELERLVDELASTPTVEDPPRALVLTGAGDRAFSTGADVSELDGLSADAARAQMRRGQTLFDRLETLPIVVIAAINGFALGGGLELAMAADLRVASPTARLGQPEIALANVPGWGGTQRLPRLIGRGRACELILTGDLIDAQRAYEWGLVNVIADDPVRAGIELAARICAHGPVAVAGAKQAIRVGLTEGMQAGLLAEADAVATCCQTPEQQRAVRTFLARHR